jgi:hypothetical protein
MGAGAIVENGKVVGPRSPRRWAAASCARRASWTRQAIQTSRRRRREDRIPLGAGVRASERGAGPAPSRRDTINSDFGFVDDSSAYDLWLFGLGPGPARPTPGISPKCRTPANARRIVPDYAVNAQDVTARRPFPDVVVQCRSRQDSHGYLTDDFRFLSEPSANLIKMKRETSLSAVFDVNVPLRSLLPKGVRHRGGGIGSGCAGTSADDTHAGRSHEHGIRRGHGCGDGGRKGANSAR